MQINSKTDIGKVRSTNQDAFFNCELSDGAVFAIVCDGMGGANAGNIASETAVKRITEYTVNSYRSGLDSIGIEKVLKNAFLSANIEIYDMALKNPDLSGMGTTAVAVLLKENTAVIAHIGDSRAYKIAEGITQITTDHSVVQSLIEDGKLTPEEAKFHPRKNVITRAIGVEENISVDFDEVSLSEGEHLLLCTDGLTNFVDADCIKEIFDKYKPSTVTQKLVDAANKGGGSDNITVVTITL